MPNAPTRELPYGKRRLLEIGLAVAMKPSVLLLDEPAAGVPAAERQDILDTVAALPADVSVLLIEHDMDLVFSFAKRMTVLVNGAVLTEGTPEQIANDPQVKAVYLGDMEVGPCLTLLEVQGLTCGYGEAVVLTDVSFTLEAGRSLALLGRNGTGKTTLIDTLVGVTRRHAGTIRWPGQDLHTLPSHRAPRPASAGCRRNATSSSR
jgi:ABC-type branched-subunit amino acid transport system ATPase component